MYIVTVIPAPNQVRLTLSLDELKHLRSACAVAPFKDLVRHDIGELKHDHMCKELDKAIALLK